jgi:hypothetical protein
MLWVTGRSLFELTGVAGTARGRDRTPGRRSPPFGIAGAASLVGAQLLPAPAAGNLEGRSAELGEACVDVGSPVRFLFNLA